jgi:hypothetical protein
MTYWIGSIIERITSQTSELELATIDVEGGPPQQEFIVNGSGGRLQLVPPVARKLETRDAVKGCAPRWKGKWASRPGGYFVSTQLHLLPSNQPFFRILDGLTSREDHPC